jgi:hypothetical protein
MRLYWGAGMTDWESSGALLSYASKFHRASDRRHVPAGDKALAWPYECPTTESPAVYRIGR